MISGVAGMILGEAVFFGSAALLMWAAIFLAVNTLYFVLFEEPALLQKFGDQYATYKRHVPRWVPRLRPYGG
jgi:protein-S-isoprenylcysteine O-methyltransferase Ste14